MARVVVVGSGNAALCAAIAAAEVGAEVTILEAGNESDFGGNSRYTAGAVRFAYAGRDAILDLLAGSADERIGISDFGAYPKTQFAEDLRSFSNESPLNALQNLLVDESYAAVAWLHGVGVGFEPIFARQSFLKNGRYRFWGGLTLATAGEGDGLVQAERRIAEAAGCALRLEHVVTELLLDGGRVAGVRCQSDEALQADAVVLACGGFEANAELRSRHLGATWRHAKVRGTPLNTGQGIAMATAIGAATAGHYGACHAVCMDVSTPNFGASTIPHSERKNFRKISYVFGVMLNRNGVRFVDEGADFRNYTYAQYGKAVLDQPGGVAWQIFDGQVEKLLYEEYRRGHATRYRGGSLEELIAKLPGIDRRTALRTLEDYNQAAVGDGFDPTIKDGCRTQGLDLPKSNWALPLRTPPFLAFEVTGGITFTYGGLAVSTDGEVLDGRGAPIDGLFAAGEIVGGIFFDGYPGGSGLTAGAVMGRRAGRSAASSVM